MSLILNFAIGFIAAFVGVIPPGFLNMSAAKISMAEGRKKGLLFSIGVCVTVIIQTYVALLFARYLDKHPEVVDTLQKMALGIFICITIYFFFIAKDTRRAVPKEINKSKTSRFFSGMFLGALNLLPLPYWVYISITFAGFGWFTFTQPELWAAVVASGLGTFVMLGLYVQFFKKKENQERQRVNMNYIIGAITTVISIITAFKIFSYF
ncbi:threonine/homoserine/homoserine lactone efflux protein [Ulvibacter sp. MAR_2010_11]|uniref:lysine transporter LysE n=1 Tax=Ulvibacter sp. MAR_2010_11 TaxID=1250229 RepID=UPI000C2BD9F1|nr:lysine transporter LysE [Ulvibacter sp. MAR_2010_11]PKA82653.1 threonine/homoserine/homoserine lactone efflux protein [Ulvibacter sp. MAR_2010_11]